MKLSQDARDKIALAKMELKKVEAARPLAEQLEIARSKVRRRLSYMAAGLFCVLVCWCTVWFEQADRSVTMVALNTCVAIIFYWFGQRSVKPPTFQ